MSETQEKMSFAEELERDLNTNPANEPIADATIKPKRGRPKKVPPPPPEPTVKPVPQCNEIEAAIIAQAIMSIANNIVKKEYRDKLNFTIEECLSISRPLVILKDYYLPNIGGIYAVWGQLVITGGAIGFSKYNAMKEIMENDREKSNLNSRDEGDREVDEGKGIAIVTPEVNNL